MTHLGHERLKIFATQIHQLTLFRWLQFPVGSTAAWPIVARAEQPERQRRVGFLRAEKPPAPWMDAFQKPLRELGYEEGKNQSLE
jgi:hypothetical protein